jgi:4-amino-4-deoxy-L-arabinose transferase-like glycosyltransferase
MSLPRLFIKAAIPVVSIFLILAGIIQLRAQIWATGAVSLILAMIGFIFSIRFLERKPFSTEEIEVLRPLIIPTILWTMIISLLTISTFYVADNFKSAKTDRIAAIAWAASVILGMITIGRTSSPLPDRVTLREKIKANRRELIPLLIIVVLAFALRTIDLSVHPYPWSGDEASIGSEAIRILHGEVTNFFDTGWSSQPNWSFVPTAVTEYIFGKNILAVRLTSVLSGILAVLFVYLAGREFFNSAIGLMAAAFLTTLPYHVHFSRIGVNNVMDSLMSALFFWLIAKGLNTDDSRYYYVAGVVAGLCIYTYTGTRLVLILGGIVLLFLMIRQKGYLASHRKHLIVFSIAAIVSAAPQAAFFVRHPDIFVGRLGQEGILFNGWITQQAVQTGESVWEILFNQFTRTIMVFIASSAPGNFFNSPDPYLTILGSILFLLGMGYALAYALETRYFILLIWFWTVILLGGILTLNPPANTRLLMTSPVVALFMAVGSFKILEYLQKFKIVPERVIAPILILLVSIIAYQNINYYMLEYKNNAYFEDANGEYAMEISLMANQRGNDFQIFVLGAPRVFAAFPTFAFVAPTNPRSDLYPENIEALQLPTNKQVGFFATPENRQLLQQIIQRYPGGEGGLVYRRTKPDQVLFEYYIIDPRE